MYNKIFDNIKINKPIIIKNFISKNKYKESIEELIKLSNMSNNKNNFLQGSKYIQSKNNLLINDILKELDINKNIKIYDEYRIWNHKKNNITQWHYDGNGIDVINICLCGKKKFILAEPNSQITFPFTNITLLETHKKEYTYILEPGDLLLIPRFWFHKVISLKDNTITMNFCITNNHNNIPNNLKMLYNLHNYLNTSMSKQNICKYPNIKIGLDGLIYHFLKENIILFILFLILKLIFVKILNITHNIYNMYNNLDKFLLLSLITEYKYHNDSVGMSRLILVNSFLNNFIIDKLIQ